MKLGEKLQNNLLAESTKNAVERLEPYFMEFSSNLEKGCILKFEKFTLEEKKTLLKQLEDEGIKAKGVVSMTYDSSIMKIDKLDVEYLNEAYYLVWDKTAIETSDTIIPYPCGNCITTECQDGYHCKELEYWTENKGKLVLTSYDVSKELYIEKCELGYKVGVKK